MRGAVSARRRPLRRRALLLMPTRCADIITRATYLRFATDATPLLCSILMPDGIECCHA